MPEPRVIQTTWEYRGYTIQDDGGHGFYKALNPRGHYIGSGEGMGTVRDIVDEHIEKVFGFWDLNCVMSPLVARAARQLSNSQAEQIIANEPITGNALNGYHPVKDDNELTYAHDECECIKQGFPCPCEVGRPCYDCIDPEDS